MKIDFVMMFSEKRAKRGGKKLQVLSLPLPENIIKLILMVRLLRTPVSSKTI